MAYALICHDKPGSLELRKVTREQHLAYLKANPVLLAGPLLGDDGSPSGSLVIVDLASEAEAQSFAAGDPYAEAGLFAEVTIRPFNPSVGSYLA